MSVLLLIKLGNSVMSNISTNNNNKIFKMKFMRHKKCLLCNFSVSHTSCCAICAVNWIYFLVEFCTIIDVK